MHFTPQTSVVDIDCFFISQQGR